MSIVCAFAIWPAPDLVGRWLLRRRVVGQARFVGEAEARRVADGRVAWLERGVLTLDTGGQVAAHRALIYEVDERASVISLFHGDGAASGALIHRFVFSDSRLAHDVHDCPPDRYAARLRLFTPDHFQLTYRVDGPRKGYWMSTVYRKLAAAGKVPE